MEGKRPNAGLKQMRVKELKGKPDDVTEKLRSSHEIR